MTKVKGGFGDGVTQGHIRYNAKKKAPVIAAPSSPTSNFCYFSG
jgi:hypothetical protein